MSENQENLCHMCALPTELILNIFFYLPAKDLVRCRRVCSRWQIIVDSISTSDWSDDLWIKYCKQDFPNIFRSARIKAKLDLIWFELYKSLSLWSRLSEARESRDEFASASGVMQEIRACEVLEDSVISVHTKNSINFYDIETLEVSKRGPINGHYSRFKENRHVIVILNYELHLFIIRKYLRPCHVDSNATFDNVKMFTLTDNKVYFVTLNDEIYVCNIYSIERMLTARFVTQSPDSVMVIGCSDEHLNILTFTRNIYSIINSKLVLVCSLGPDSNIFRQLQKYNLLEQMDWRVYVQWMYVFNHTIPEGPFRDLIIVRQYADIFFVGTNWGVLRIYYAPPTDEFDILNMEPVKQYNFMERSDCPVLSTCPVIDVDVMEVENGHIVFVAMPKKIAVLNFTHNFKRTASLALLPYSEVQKDKLLKIDEPIAQE